jgi:hypothetical protein
MARKPRPKPKPLSRGKRIALTVLLIVLAFALIFSRSNIFRHLPAAQVAENQDSRPLTSGEMARALPLICQGQSGGTGNYQTRCTGLNGYIDMAGPAPSYNISLTAIVTGHITSADADQAYVSYTGDFEDHADNFGGGILFEHRADGWHLSGWYPGGQAEKCVAITPTGRARLLCLYSAMGQGEQDTMLAEVTIPPASGGAGEVARSPVLKASDERQTLNPDANCDARKNDTQTVLLSIDDLKRGGSFAVADFHAVSAADATNFCAKKDIADAPVGTGELQLTSDGAHIAVAPGFDFAPSNP